MVLRRLSKYLRIMNRAEMRVHQSKNLSSRRRLKRRRKERRKKKEKKRERKEKKEKKKRKGRNQMKKRQMIKIQKMKPVNMLLLRTKGNQRPKANSLFQLEKLLQKKNSLMNQLKIYLPAQ